MRAFNSVEFYGSDGEYRFIIETESVDNTPYFEKTSTMTIKQFAKDGEFIGSQHSPEMGEIWFENRDLHSFCNAQMRVVGDFNKLQKIEVKND